jgi:hypothetical protein
MRQAGFVIPRGLIWLLQQSLMDQISRKTFWAYDTSNAFPDFQYFAGIQLHYFIPVFFMVEG